MKILYVTTISDTVNSFLIPHIKMLVDLGNHVDVAFNINQEVRPEIIDMGCKIHILDFQRSPINVNNYVAYKKLKKIIRDEKYELVHTHTPVASAIVRLVCKNIKDIKVLYTAHGFHFFKGAPLKNWLFYYPVEKWLSRYTDIIITINKEDYKRAKNFKNTRIEYIPGVGINTDKFENVKTDKEKKRKSLGIGNDEFMILSVGELNKNKNHQIIIKAIARLNNRKIKYVICGQGPLKDELIILSKELKVERQVCFLGFRSDVSEIYKAADLFAFPSYREGLSLSLMEAMSSGLPVICSNIRGNSDLINDGKGGYLTNPDDVSGFGEAIKRLVDNDRLRRKIGRYNTTLVKKYSINCIIQKMADLYTELLSN